MVTVRWDVELSAQTHEVVARRVPWYSGETVELCPRLVVERMPVVLPLSADVRAYVRDASGTWYLAGTGGVVSGEVGRVSVSVPPSAMPAGAEHVPFRVAIVGPSGRNYHAAGVLDVLDAPGPQPSDARLPVRVLDWSAVEHDHVDAAPFELATPSGVLDVTPGESSVRVTFPEREVRGAIATVLVPSGGALLVCCVADVTPTGFTVLLSAAPDVAGYRVAWRTL